MASLFNINHVAVIPDNQTTYFCPHCETTVDLTRPEAVSIGDAAFEKCGDSPGHHYVTITHGSGENKTYQHICYGKKAGPRGGHAHGGEIKHYQHSGGSHGHGHH